MFFRIISCFICLWITLGNAIHFCECSWHWAANSGCECSEHEAHDLQNDREHCSNCYILNSHQSASKYIQLRQQWFCLQQLYIISPATAMPQNHIPPFEHLFLASPPIILEKSSFLL